MIVRSFKPVGWVAAVAGAALGCYMLSLNVAAERAELAAVERQIIAAKQDIRALQTELGTRGRLAQLEHWNAEVLALSAPASRQFLQNEFRLASFTRPQATIDEQAAQVRMASAQINSAQPGPKAAVAQDFEAMGDAPAAKPLLRRASLVIPSREDFSERAAPARAAPQSSSATSSRPEPAASMSTSSKPVAAKPILAKASSAKRPLTKAGRAKPTPPKKPGLIDEDVLGEIGAVARLEKQNGGAGDR